MNTVAIAPEVQQFLDAVRAQLADLDPEEQRDITDGLEADLTELVADRGVDALGDPVDYARELRSAAGLSHRTIRPLREVRASVDGFLDACHAWADRRIEALPRDLRPLLAWLRPVWWILRAWAAVLLADVMFGDNPWSGTDLVPHLRGFGWVVMLAAVLVSVQVGRGNLWPGGERGVSARVLLLGLNAFAIAVTPLMIGQVESGSDDDYWSGYDGGYASAAASASGQKEGVYLDGSWVSQIYPYDAQGRPLVGVQLFNQVGKPIKVVTQPEYEDSMDGPVGVRMFYPWTNGSAQLTNVFPIPSRVQGEESLSPTAFTEAQRPRIGPFPLVLVPEVSLPGIHTGVRPDLAGKR